MAADRTLSQYSRTGNSKLQVWRADGEDSFAERAFSVLEATCPSILEEFQIVESFPLVTVVLVPDRAEFDRLVRDLLKIEIEVPSHPARIAQPQRTDMIVLSPSAYAEHSVFEYVPANFERLLVHEFIHMIEEFLSPNIEASPGWWSEGLAVYFSGQSRCEDGFRKTALAAIASDDIPTLPDILEDGSLAYDWGWTLVQFIDATFGRDKILETVRRCADGAVLSFLDSEIGTFEEAWRHWLRMERTRPEG